MSDLEDRKVLTLAGMRRIAAAAEAEALGMKVAVSIALLDDGGHLVHFVRMDGAPPASIDVAQAKARCAAMFRMPTKFWEDAYTGGKTHLMALPGALPIEGGVPLTVGGKIVGAIGVSGASSIQDGQVVAAGVAALG